MTGYCCVFKFLRRNVDAKHLMRFQSETSVFKFLRRNVDAKHLMCFQSETSVFKFLRRNVDRALDCLSSALQGLFTTDLSFCLFPSLSGTALSGQLQQKTFNYNFLQNLKTMMM